MISGDTTKAIAKKSLGTIIKERVTPRLQQLRLD